MNSSKLRKSCSRSNQGSSESERSINSRPETRNQMLTWYIPRFIASSRGITAHNNRIKKMAQSACQERQEALSPLHNNSKQLWDEYYTDDKIRSLPIPPSHFPRQLDSNPPHANNITHIFKSSNYPASVLYSRYGIPLFPINAQFDTAHKSDMVWHNKPLQSMFAHVGGTQRRHFTVAPDWRHLSKTL
ncbi:PREDICTED: uncharacterized protein LOC100631956 [Amphimedon queenslandica]|uniref:Uncharacterized protein n=1 Tax=Amphimedon queenslandica TaxID=400682 RepID=A0A1X7U8V2_AMPQE|nr:PREDICTED: uncharacterized protein LOC100631956 [Amphimedon queenslandica]|eukprot:XP_003388604.1 PREDICTED: uncharacterized protein LOC100631956 [Amphimedon queenslandica]